MLARALCPATTALAATCITAQIPCKRHTEPACSQAVPRLDAQPGRASRGPGAIFCVRAARCLVRQKNLGASAGLYLGRRTGGKSRATTIAEQLVAFEDVDVGHHHGAPLQHAVGGLHKNDARCVDGWAQGGGHCRGGRRLLLFVWRYVGARSGVVGISAGSVCRVDELMSSAAPRSAWRTRWLWYRGWPVP